LGGKVVNGTTKQRYISTTIWSDGWFDSLSGDEKLIYLHLLTNPHTNPAGVYPFALKYICADTGCSREEVNAAIGKFEETGKAFFYREYIIIPKWLKHQKTDKRSGLFLGAIKILKSLPDEIKAFISDRKHYDFDISKYINGPFETLPPKKGGPSPPKKGDPPPNSAHDLDLDLDLDLELDSSGSSSTDPKNSGVDNSWKKPPPLINYIKKESEALGFFIDTDIARIFQNCGLDPPWLTGPHSFLEYCALTVKKKYPDKNPDELKPLYISAIKGWEDLRKSYPPWKAKQLKITQEKEKEKEINNLCRSPPKKCECGSDLLDQGGRCVCTKEGCYLWYEVDEVQLKWILRK
jgi:hypothetical protein